MAYTDRFPIVNNFLETRLSADCDEGETTLYLESVDALPRILAGRDYIPLVLRDAGSVREIVYVDSVDVDSGAIVVKRGQEGTNSVAWSAGSYVYCTVTADSFQRMRVNGFAPLVDGTSGRPEISVTSSTTAAIVGDYTAQVEVGMAVRVLAGDSVVEPNDATMGAIHISGVEYSGSVTNIAFQNVTLPKNVSGLDLGISVAAAPLYHPDTIVADNDTTSQRGNVISADLAVQKAVQEAQQEDSALDSTLRAFIAEEVAKYLPLAGGVMTGGVEFDRADGHIFKRDSEGRMVIRGGAGTPDAGASVYLYGADHPDDPGRLLLQSVAPGGGYLSLDLDKGKALIGEKNVVRSVNGFDADGLGDVQINAVSRGNVSANTLTAQGVYFVNGENTALPSGTNGYIVVDSVDGLGFVRQIFYRAGTVGSNDHNIYTRQRGSDGAWGAWVKMLTGKDNGAVESQSIASEGYVRLAGGLQICWGNCASGSYKSFPKAFSAKPSVVTGHSMSGTDGNREATGAYIETSRFYYKSTGSAGGRYIAFGPWA